MRWRSITSPALAPSRVRAGLGVASVMLSCLSMVACGGLSYPDDRPVWTLAASPNAVAGGELVGNLSLMDDGNGNPLATLSEIAFKEATSTEARQSLDVSWRGTWSVDGDTTTLSLECLSATAQNLPNIDCPNTSLTRSCSVKLQKLDCGDYQFE